MTAADIIINVVERPVEFDLAELAFDLHADTQNVIFTKVPAALAKLGVVVGSKCSQVDGEAAYPYCDAVEKRRARVCSGDPAALDNRLGRSAISCARGAQT